MKKTMTCQYIKLYHPMDMVQMIDVTIVTCDSGYYKHSALAYFGRTLLCEYMHVLHTFHG